MISAAPAVPAQKTASTNAAGRPIANKRSIISGKLRPEGGSSYDAKPAVLQAACPQPPPALLKGECAIVIWSRQAARSCGIAQRSAARGTSLQRKGLAPGAHS